MMVYMMNESLPVPGPNIEAVVYTVLFIVGFCGLLHVINWYDEWRVRRRKRMEK